MGIINTTWQTVWHKGLRRPYKLAKPIDIGQDRFGKEVTILLLHGLAARATKWDPVVKLLAHDARYRIVAFDLLGFGASPKPEHVSYTIEDHARAIIASLDRSAKAQPMIVVGHSMGCLLATHIAAHHPNLVQHLVLYEPPLFADSPEFRSHAKRRQLYFALFEMLIKRPRLFFQYSKWLNRLDDSLPTEPNTADWHAFRSSLENTIMQQTAYNELRDIALPTEIIYGKYDLIVTRKEVKNMLAHNPNIRFHMVNDKHDITKRSAQQIHRIIVEITQASGSNAAS